MQLDYTSITRNDFMAFFRDDEMLNQLSADDRIEVFSQVLTGSSDITKELLDSVISDYSVGDLIVIEVDPDTYVDSGNFRSVKLDSKSLLTKWGFEDGDCLDGLTAYGDFDEAQVLEALVRIYLLPVMDEEVELIRLGTIHNPIKALKINGDHVTDFWDDETRMEGLLNDKQVVVSGDQVLTVATLLREPILSLESALKIHRLFMINKGRPKENEFLTTRYAGGHEGTESGMHRAAGLCDRQRFPVCVCWLWTSGACRGPRA